MKAPKNAQLRLLDLQALDTRLDQLDHRVANLSERQAYDALVGERAAADTEALRARAAADDAARELQRAEADVQQVADREVRTQSRLDAGQGSAKELQSMQHELESLARRRGDLEETQLEVMERAEGLTADAERAATRRGELEGRLKEAADALEAALGHLEGERESVATDRAAVVPDVPAELLSLYEKVRVSSGGTGAAALVGKRCGGCRLELGPIELSEVRSAAEDEVVRCPDCRRIIVRTPESAL